MSARHRGPQDRPWAQSADHVDVNANRQQAVESLDRLKSLGQITLLPEHGDPWYGEMDEVIQLAQR